MHFLERERSSSPLELFRANEQINAHKRRSLAQEILCLDIISSDTGNENLRTIVMINITTQAGKKLCFHRLPAKRKFAPSKIKTKKVHSKKFTKNE